jgi:hypothetical protein
MAQLRVEVRVVSGLHVRLQGGMGLQRDGSAGYGFVPIELGATWRFGVGPVVPYADAHAIVNWFDDSRDADGLEIEGERARAGFGGGAGGGVEFRLLDGPVALAVAPEVHVGWSGVFLLQGGVGVRVGF